MSRKQGSRRTRAVVITVAMLTLVVGPPASAADAGAGGASAGAAVAQLPAPQIMNLQATGAAGHWVVLSWDYPTGAAIDRVELRYSKTDFPQNLGEGTDPDPDNDPGGEDLDPGDDEWTVRGLDNHVPYFFSIFTSDDGGATWSAPATVRQRPYVCPKVSFAINAPPGVIQEKLWTACSGPMAVDAHNTLGTSVKDGEQALMTTGSRAFAVPPGADDQGADNNTGYRDAFDVSVLRLLLQIPDGKHCVRVNYVFATEGDPAAGGIERDAFLVHKNTLDWEVDEQSGGTLDPGTNVAALTNGEYVGLGSAAMGSGASLLGPGTGPDQNGSGYDLMTRPMNLSVPVAPGTSPKLYLSLFDRGASDTRDSAVFVDSLRLLDATCDARTNRWPAAALDAKSFTGSQTTVAVTDNDTDPDVGDSLVATVDTQPAHGTASCTGTDCTYTRSPGFIGNDSFTYRVSDGNGGFDIGRVNITVQPANDVHTSISSPTPIVTWPAKATINGTVTEGAQPRPGVAVRLEVKPFGATTFARVTTVTSGTGGAVTARHQPQSQSVYRWVVPGVVNQTSEETTVKVRPALTIAASPSAVGLGDSVSITGKASPSRGGTPVQLQKLAGGVWQTVQQSTVAASPVGSFGFTVRPRASGVAKYRVLVPARDGRLLAISASRTLRVYDAAITRVTKTAHEVVTIKNTGKLLVNTKGWKLRDRSGETVTLPKRLVKPGAFLRVHFQRGPSDANDVYLRHEPIFGNTHDLAKLIDRHRFLLSKLRY